MKIIRFNEQYPERINIALGHFDAIHNGHMSLINKCKETIGGETAVFLFDVNPIIALGGQAKVIHTLKERLYRLEALGVDTAVIAEANSGILNNSADEFLEKLSGYNINLCVMGNDYKCGCGGCADAAYVREYLQNHNINAEIMPLINSGGDKISTGGLYDYLKNGDIRQADALMPLPYTVIGNVTTGRQVGRTFGIPTANLDIPSDKLLPPDGVYAAAVKISDKFYKAVTNIGGKPTFGCDDRTIESFILNFDGDIYGQEIVLFIIDRLRNVKRFNGALELKAQILLDIDKTEKTVDADIIKECGGIQNDKIRS